MGNKRIQKLNCSPTRKGSDNKFTCYTSDELKRLKTMWNVRHIDDLIMSDEPKEIWTGLKDRLHNVCNKESCWLRQQFVTSDVGTELLNSFSPQQPKIWKKNPYEWLTTTDIQNVMKQYEDAYDDFEFIGPSPIDYNKNVNNQCVWPELCNFNIEEKLLNGINKIGIIFNLDTHNEPGSHWVVLYVELSKREIYYFDSTKSYKREIPKEIIKFIDDLNNNAETLFKFKLDFAYNNKIEHQKQNTECGIYCIYFITQLLTNKKVWKDFIDERIPDAEMKKFRNIFFNKNTI
jgi:hypothetical protein